MSTSTSTFVLSTDGAVWTEMPLLIIPTPTMWGLSVGETVVRKKLHDEYAGKRFNGISPSTSTANVMLFHGANAEGADYGYVDRWDADGYYHYSGEGTGDQKMVGGNKAVRDHAAAGRKLRLFHGSSEEVEYLGEFEYVDHFETRAESRGSRRSKGTPFMRDVIVFRLRPVGPVAARVVKDAITDVVAGSPNG